MLSTNATYTSPGWTDYKYPLSLSPIPKFYMPGLIVLCITSAFSTFTTAGLLGFLSYRFFTTRNSHRAPLYKNQYMLLISQLVLADFQCALGFFINVMWLQKDAFISPSAGCIVQGWLLNLGDLASCFFVVTIACHTFATIVYRKRVSFRVVCWAILACWVLALFTTVLPVILHPSNIFVLQGGWCSINGEYDKLRLYCHYVWDLGGEGLVIVIYGVTFIVLRKRLSSLKPSLNRQSTAKSHDNENARSQNSTNSKRVTRATMYMIIYPAIYLLTTLPLAAARIASMVGHSPPLDYLFAGGILMSLGGLFNCIFYSLTRHIFTQPSVSLNTTMDPRRSRYGKGTLTSGIELSQSGVMPTGKYGELPSPMASTDQIVHTESASDTVSSLEPREGVRMETTWEVTTEILKPNMERAESPTAERARLGTKTVVF